MGVSTLNYKIRNKVFGLARRGGGTPGMLILQIAFIIHFCFGFSYYSRLKVKNTYLKEKSGYEVPA